MKPDTLKKITLAFLLFASPVFAQIGITIGTPEPVCTYGYYDYAPYACAPSGYYGPEFFVGGRYHPRRAWGQNDNHRGTGYHQKPNAGRPYSGHSNAKQAKEGKR